MENNTLRFFLIPAHLFGIGCFSAAIVAAFIELRLAAVPLFIFIFICLLAPFFPKIGFFLPVIHKGNSSTNGIALTFDDGPDPYTTPLLLELLSNYKATATFFVTGKKADMYPELIKNILFNGHCIGNHSYAHDTMIMLKSGKYLQKDIENAQNTLIKQGITPLAFRPPVGITNPKLFKVLDINGLYCVNYNRRARDGGNRWIKGLSKNILKHLKPNDIVMIHDTFPKKNNKISDWLNEVENLLLGIPKKDLAVLPLSEIIGKPVMKMHTNTRLDDRKTSYV